MLWNETVARDWLEVGIWEVLDVNGNTHGLSPKIIYGNDYGINGGAVFDKIISYLFKNQEIAKKTAVLRFRHTPQ